MVFQSAAALPLPATADPTPRGHNVAVTHPALEVPIIARSDHYSDRLRCDHPGAVDGQALGEALLDLAQAQRRGRVLVLARPETAAGLEAAGLAPEAVIPGFYGGTADCVVLGGWPDPDREALANPVEVERVHALVEAGAGPGRSHPPVETRRAAVTDAPAIAELMAETFATYPTPSGDPAYVRRQIASGQPFRLVETGRQVVACASADLVVQARTAELTDCATRPEQRGRGLMQALLSDLMEDLRALGYPTAFTLARARIPGVNLAFQRLGFALSGTLSQSVRIGEGLEDMNVWSRRLLA